MLRGIDISSHQPQIDWAKVAATNDFVIIKATGGLSYVNPRYHEQVAGARGVGLLVGHYHFAHEASIDGTGPREPEDEAKRFLAHADIQPGELVALDIEDTAIAGDLSGWALRWLRYVEANTGCLPLLYSFPFYITDHGLGTTELAAYPLWYASYRTPEKDNPWPSVPGKWGDIAVWQWSGGSAVAGIPNPTDQNVSRLTLDQLRAFGKPAVVQAETKPPAPSADPGSVHASIDAQGHTHLDLDFGGIATSIDGYTVVDAGVSVTNAKGEKWSRTFRDGRFLDWHQ